MRKLMARFAGPEGGLRSQLIRGSLANIFIKAIYIVIQFAVGVMLARLLGPEDLGTYAFTIALVQVMAIIGQAGFPAYLVRSVALYSTHEAFSELKGLLIGSFQIVIVLSLIVTNVGVAWLIGSGVNVGQVPPHIIMTGLVLVPLLAMGATNSGAIRGLGYVVVGQIPDQIIRPAVYLAVLLTIYAFGLAFSLKDILLVYAGALFASLVAGFVLLIRHAPRQMRNITAEMHRTQWLRQSFPFLLLAGVQVLNYQTDVVMLGMLSTQEQVGLYRVAIQVADGLGVLLFAISLVIEPQLARLHAQQDWQRVQRLLVYSHRIATLVMLPVVLLIVGISTDLVTLLFGAEFRPASSALDILSLGKIIYATVGFSGLALSMFGHAGTAAYLALITVVMNVTLNFMLIPYYGIDGAAVATVVSQFIVNMLGVIYIKLKFRFDTSVIGVHMLNDRG